MSTLLPAPEKTLHLVYINGMPRQYDAFTSPLAGLLQLVDAFAEEGATLSMLGCSSASRACCGLKHEDGEETVIEVRRVRGGAS